MPVSKKWALTAIFGLGIFDDSTYWISINGIFLILEPNLGIINACLPILKPIIPRLRPKKVLWPSFSHKSSESTAIQLHTVTREDARYFKRLEDVPCLPGDIEAQTINEVTAQSQSDITGLGDILPTGARRVQDEGSRPRLPANAITVTASWDVQSTPTDHV
ncbi:MAG: hypothetical protein M1820_006054 [Bogoriella megaspora]|nr:MAG: hypothetical protein M1820_006054 [Bogoriella megaspora]